MLDVETVFRWSPWQPLLDSWQRDRVPDSAGLYRIRRVGRNDLDYIGQTGTGSMTLRQRLGMLRGVYGSEMPYRDPHTAGPALWALRDSTAADFQVSVLPVQGTSPWRKGLEALAISLYRQEHGASPNANFGQMPLGYRMSSGNNAGLLARGLRYHGGPTVQSDASHALGIAPVGPLSGAIMDAGWGDHAWSRWTTIPDAVIKLSPSAVGLYRIRGRVPDRLLYIGQGLIRNRIIQHGKKAARGLDTQGRTFRDGGPLEVSWVVSPDWSARHRLELENDLIAAYVLHYEGAPPAQFIG